MAGSAQGGARSPALQAPPDDLVAQRVKNLPAPQETGVQSLEEGNGNPLPYSCLENPVDRGAWWVTVNGGRKSWT